MMPNQNSLVAVLKQDQRNVGLRAAETLGYFGLGHGASQGSDRSYVVCGQEFLETSDPSDIDRVLFITRVVSPFEIGYDAIRFDSIEMVDHRKMVRVGDEGECDQSVDVNRFAESVSVEIDVLVSEFARTRSENLSIYSSGFQPVADAVQTSNATEITDLVGISEFIERNRSPFFRESDIHSTGCPSDMNRSTIKDPSCVATFGGSAIMAVSSATYNRRHHCQ